MRSHCLFGVGFSSLKKKNSKIGQEVLHLVRYLSDRNFIYPKFLFQ